VNQLSLNFTGDVYLTPIFNGDGTSRLVVGLVRFTPGTRYLDERQGDLSSLDPATPIEDIPVRAPPGES